MHVRYLPEVSDMAIQELIRDSRLAFHLLVVMWPLLLNVWFKLLRIFQHRAPTHVDSRCKHIRIEGDASLDLFLGLGAMGRTNL